MQQDKSLLHLNTFQVDTKCKFYLEIKSEYDLTKVINFYKENDQLFVLGGGANTLFVRDFDGLVARNLLKGIEVLEEEGDLVKLRVASGENWEDFVTQMVENNWSGVENLASVPGSVGAAVAQNIAAYGQNIEDVVLSVYGINLKSGETFHFSKKDCDFKYRDSLFRKVPNKDLFITSVEMQLSKKPNYNTNYYSRRESLAEELKAKTTPYSTKDIYEAVVSLRRKKLPNWKKIGTAGSFFKNPIVDYSKYLKLQSQIEELQCYPVDKLEYIKIEEIAGSEQVKIPAGRLLEELGWKGKKIGKVATFEKTALVVINLGGASGHEIWEFTQKMAEDVLSSYDIKLIPEVLILN